MPGVERARPLLGTIVSIRAEMADPEDCLVAVERAFARIARVHDRMSFQSPDSDLAAIARLGGGKRCTVDALTADCLSSALGLARASGGAFDPVLPGSGADWRDLVVTDTTVEVARPLRVDLSGIAKGFAVDRACDALGEAGVDAAIVNAGGDLRVIGPEQIVALTPRHDAQPAAVRIADGALASSDVAGSRAIHGVACHRDGRDGRAIEHGFVSVAAPLCRDADALTKLVLALGDDAAALLGGHGAVAYLHDPGKGWWTLGEQA